MSINLQTVPTELSSKEDVEPYVVSDDSDSNSGDLHNGKRNIGSPNARDGGVDGGDIMETISQYNEHTVLSGAAAEQAYLEAKCLEEGKKLPILTPKFGFFAPENAQLRKTVLVKYLKVVVIFWIFILSVWSIYWGSMYQRQTRYTNLSILVGVEDDISLPISKALKLATESGDMPELATWVFKSNMSEAEVQRSIYNQDYWAAIYVTSNNVSSILINSFQQAQNITNSEDFVHSYFETGRDPNSMGAIVEPTLYSFASYFQYNLQKYSYPAILSNLTTEQFTALKNTNLLTSYPIIEYTDGIPVETVTNGPLQIGLIYIIIITFFQVMWLNDIYGMVAKCTVTRHFVLFQFVLSQITFLFVSLALTCLNSAFQIKMNNAWDGGFGVFWMVSYLTMSAVGGANNNVSLILFAVYPPLMGFWMLFFVIINISATFAPIQLCPAFFRFTYAMPIKNAYELMKVTLFNTSKKNIGREFGILIAWGVLNTILLPFCMAFFATRMKKKIMKEQQAQLQKEKESIKKFMNKSN